MRSETIEIYSDATNAAVLRHPDRRFPGVLIQGDTLHRFLQALDRVRAESASLSEDGKEELDDLAHELADLLDHYKSTLLAHGLELPFRSPMDR